MITTKRQTAPSEAIANNPEIVRFTNDQNQYRMSLVDYTICAIQWIAVKSLEVTVKAVNLVVRGFEKKPKASHY